MVKSLTLPTINKNNETLRVTLYTIDNIQEQQDGNTILSSSGIQFLIPIPYLEMFEKVKRFKEDENNK
jgi:hypothetical protein